jgi:type I restriction enzyme S subunit
MTAMIRSTVRYPSYTDTGLPWLGRIPAHWLVTYLKFQTRFINGAAFKPGEWSSKGTPIIRIENLNGSDEFNRCEGHVDAKYHVRDGDLLFAWSGNIGTSFGPYLWSKAGLFYLNQHIFRLDGYDLQKKYFYWVLKAVTSFIESKTSGIIGLVHVTKADLGRIPVPQIPADEQVGIANFLDLKTSEMDRLIEKKRRLIELFEEQKKAAVNIGVTRGTDPNVPLKPSGIDWIGEYPAHWSLKRIKHILRAVDERSETGKEPLLSMRMYHGLVPYDDHYERAPQVATLVGYKLVRPGQVVVNRMQAGNGLIFASSLFGLVSPDYSVFNVSEDVLPAFVATRFRSDTARKKFRQESKGLGTGTSGFLRLYDDRLAAIHIAMPPKAEQAKILDHLNITVGRIEEAISTAKREIELIQEFRTALISEIITGKLDVRAAEKVEA